MKRKIIFVVLPLLLGLSIASHILYAFDIRANEAIYLYRAFFGAFQLAGVWWLYTQGTLRKSPLRRFIYTGIGTFWLGQLFIIQHWASGRMILFLSSTGIAVIYGIHFLKKKRKSYMDGLKLAWVILFLMLMVIAVIADRDKRLWIGWALNINSILLIGLFYFQTYKRKESRRFELSEEEATVFDYKE